MMKNRILLLWHIVHPALLPRLCHQRPILRLSELTLLVLLRHIARRTATRTQTVFAAVALQVIFRAHVPAVKHGHDEGNAYTGEAAEAHALWNFSTRDSEGAGRWGQTYAEIAT
jgi:hypothetical protein